MSHVIQAVFENGVFKPLQSVSMRDHEKVELKVLSLDDWQSRFRAVIDRLHARTAGYAPDELEEDVGLARREAREERRGR